MPEGHRDGLFLSRSRERPLQNFSSLCEAEAAGFDGKDCASLSVERMLRTFAATEKVTNRFRDAVGYAGVGRI